MAERDQIERYSMDDQSKFRGGTTALMASALFGPVGLAVGAGIGYISSRMHKSALDNLVEQRRTDIEFGEQITNYLNGGEVELHPVMQRQTEMARKYIEHPNPAMRQRGIEMLADIADQADSWQYDLTTAGEMRQSFDTNMDVDQRLYDDSRVTDIDVKQHQMIYQRMDQAQKMLSSPNPDIRARGWAMLEQATNERREWAQDIEDRARTVGDMEQQRQWQVQDDLTAFERQVILQDRNLTRGAELQLFRDDLTRLREANQSRGAERKATDSILATVEAGSFEMDGVWHLNHHARSQVDKTISSQAGVAFAGRVSSNPGAAAVQFGAKFVESAVKVMTGQTLTDAERIAFVQAMDDAGELQHQNVIDKASQPLRDRAETLGMDPSAVEAAKDYDFSKRQHDLRSQYGRQWSTERYTIARTPPADTSNDQLPPPEEAGPRAVGPGGSIDRSGLNYDDPRKSKQRRVE